MKPRVWVSEIQFNDGTSITLEKDEIILFVGPNNVGKSVSLKDIQVFVKSNNTKSKIISKINLSKEGSIDDLMDYFRGTEMIDETHQNSVRLQSFGLNVSIVGGFTHTWDNYENGISSLTDYFSSFLNTVERLKLVNTPDNIPLTTTAPKHPIHFLQRDANLELKFSEYFKLAFGSDLIVHRGAGSKVPVYIGERPNVNTEEGEDRISLSYAKKIETLSKLDEQGDGMKSFVGVLLNAFLAQYSMIFVDEPEAFLHPPQARLLGRMIGKELPSDRQLFIASHSGDFLRGLLDSNSQKLRIIRIDRLGDENKFCELTPDDINVLWNDSLLRHSNVLDGIFHKKIVICESDSDCRFYSAILDTIIESKNISNPDFMFIHCGGKHRIPQVIKALKQLNVDVTVICDFDVLNDNKPLEDIILNLGGDWTSLKAKWRNVKNTVDSKKPELESEDVKREIISILNSIQDKKFPKKAEKDIKAILKKTSAWSEAKQNGKSFIPSGQPTNDFNYINTEFRQIGLYIVEVGELECFDKTVGNHGPKWVNEVLEKDLKNDIELEEARKFMEDILGNL